MSAKVQTYIVSGSITKGTIIKDVKSVEQTELILIDFQTVIMFPLIVPFIVSLIKEGTIIKDVT